jgi:protein-S-isoprenylcysteine O-methyltransferase Ste14
VGDPIARLAKLRVPLGFATAAATLILATPTPRAILAGALVALAGEAVRVWAAGHLEKSREVTRSGPYRFVRHPLYVGSGVMAVGLAIASANAIVAVLVVAYFAVTVTAAVRTEEAFLRSRFGSEYDAYCNGTSEVVRRRFSWERAWRNREWRAMGGLAIFVALLAAKLVLR